MKYELHAAAVIEEPFENQVLLRRHNTEHDFGAGEVFNHLLSRRLRDAHFFSQICQSWLEIKRTRQARFRAFSCCSAAITICLVSIRTLDIGHWTLDIIFRTFDFGLWTLDFGLYRPDFGLFFSQSLHANVTRNAIARRFSPALRPARTE